ncbi:MAG TPA: adenylate/guanylate cyclase domain-containing protein [Solirubrobacteraceae bacterium]|nr:adenylate/guanylate cyclase domain-containing protein [Solirubrobacteraceae bacterium]
MADGPVNRLGKRLKLIGFGGNAVGALTTFAAVGFLFPAFGGSSRVNIDSGWVDGPVIVVAVALTGVLYARIKGRHLSRALQWLTEERTPDQSEHRLTLSLPVYMFKLDAVGWSLAAVGFALFNGIVFSWGLAAIVAATIWFGGETTCALGYLLYERALRPVTALALAARPADAMVAPGVRLRLGMAWLLGTGVPLIGVLVLGTAGAFGWSHHSEYVGAAVLFLAVVAMVTGFLATFLAARAIADPLSGVRDGLERIARGDLDVQMPVDDASEVGQLQAGFNRMADGLRERQRIRDLFGRHVGETVAKAALSEGVRLGGEEREVAALFVDIVGSTSLALALPPTEVVRLLNRFFRVVVEVIEAEGGLVNKFEGDAALCVFGAPVASPDPAGDALRAARGLAARLARELPEVDFGVGVSGGLAVAGNVGAESRLEYTVIGDPVNEAARLSELAKQRPERVLASSAALDRAATVESDAWSITESEVLRGRLAPTQLAHPSPADGDAYRLS